MTKDTLARKVAQEVGVTRKDAVACIESILANIAESCGNGEKVSLAGFGTFSVKTKRECIRRNPQTGDAVYVPESIDMKLSTSPKLKAILNS